MHYRNIQFNNSDFPLLFFLFAFVFLFKRLNRGGGGGGTSAASARQRPTELEHTQAFRGDDYKLNNK